MTDHIVFYGKGFLPSVPDVALNVYAPAESSGWA